MEKIYDQPPRNSVKKSFKPQELDVAIFSLLVYPLRRGYTSKEKIATSSSCGLKDFFTEFLGGWSYIYPLRRGYISKEKIATSSSCVSNLVLSFLFRATHRK